VNPLSIAADVLRHTWWVVALVLALRIGPIVLRGVLARVSR
jgi:hypothetical protein